GGVFHYEHLHPGRHRKPRSLPVRNTPVSKQPASRWSIAFLADHLIPVYREPHSDERAVSCAVSPAQDMPSDREIVSVASCPLSMRSISDRRTRSTRSGLYTCSTRERTSRLWGEAKGFSVSCSVAIAVSPPLSPVIVSTKKYRHACP